MQGQHPLSSHFTGGSDSNASAGSPGSGHGKHDKQERRSGQNRTNRACNNCRRMKMRCVGADDPPCKRCVNSGLECVLEKPGRSDTVGEDRIRSLETQVTSIQTTLTELVQTLRQGLLPGGQTHNVATTALPTRTPSMATDYGSAHTFGVSPENTMSQHHATPRTSAHLLTHDGHAAVTYPSTQPSSSGGTSGLAQPRQPHNAGVSWVPQLSTVRDRDHYDRGTDSLPPSRSESETAEDILGAEEIINPLGSLSKMAGLVEAAVERAREEETRSDGNRSTPLKRSGSDDHSGPRKARRGSHRTIVEAQGLPQPVTSEKAKPTMKKTHVHSLMDVVDEGMVSEEEARELMSIYFRGSSHFIPCYDPQYDTWESLRARSPFSITTIVMVGARVRDGGNPPSMAQKLAREHAQRFATDTMFNPVARVEAVQAMTILSAFSDNGWLPGGHAVRMALDMGINQSFIKLLRSGMGKGKTPEELEEERPLVVQSRVWFCLYLMEHQMAYGMGRPAILREDETIAHCRRLLEHPLSITSDARLVSTVELTALRAPLHIELTASPDAPIDHATLHRLQQANAEFDAWERYWDHVLAERFGKGKADFYRESLVIQRQYAELFVNSQLLRGIRNPADVANMPEEKRALALRATRNAQACMRICLKGENYRNGLRYAVHYTHVCAAFAATFLIRIARLFPHELDLKQTARDVEDLAKTLSEIPAGRYARSLRLILRRARKAKVIPAKSARGSPKATPLALDMTLGSDTQTPGQAAISPSFLLGAPPMLDESPSSGSEHREITEFDLLFAQENLQRSGLSLNEGESLPLFLDGHSLGATFEEGDTAPFVGLEQFFLPVDIDSRLTDSGAQNVLWR